MEEVKGYDNETEKGVGSSEVASICESNGAAADHKPVVVHGKSRRLTGPARRSSKANWTEEEDDILTDAVQKYEGKRWKKIADRLPGRTDVQCLHRWQKVLKPDLVKGPWTKEEDNLLIELVGKFSEKKWSEIAEQLPGRMGKQCRERWCNHLKPEINKAAWTEEEERVLINAHAAYGNKWSILAKLLPGRTENSVKNHWNCSLKKRLGNYSANGSAANHPPSTISAFHSNDKETSRKSVEEKQNLSCLCKERVDSRSNGKSSSLDLFLECSGNLGSYPSSAAKANNSLRPLLSTCNRIEMFLDNLSETSNYDTTSQTEVLGCTSLDENDCPHGTICHSRKPCLIRASPPKTSLPYSNSPFLDNRYNNRDVITSCSIRRRRHSDIYDYIHTSSGWSYTGLCYAPFQNSDLNIFLSTGRFPCSESYIPQPNRSMSVPPSRSHTKESSDLYSRTRNMLRSAAMSYDNMPSIIRKRAIQTFQRGVPAPDNVVGSLNRTMAANEVPKVEEDDKFSAIKSVGKCLEREFCDE